jgi:hypothetical protein
MSFLFSLLKILVAAVVFLAAVHWGGDIRIDIGESVYAVPTHVIVLVLILLLYLHGVVIEIWHSLHTYIFVKSPYEKGIGNLHLAFSAILQRDIKRAEKFVKKSKKHLGDRPLITLIEGQLLLMNNDAHRSKAVFYAPCENEKNSCPGVHELHEMAIKGNQEKLNIIDLKNTDNSTN